MWPDLVEANLKVEKTLTSLLGSSVELKVLVYRKNGRFLC
jgi:hypothetical protein